MAKPLVNNEVIVVRVSTTEKDAFGSFCYQQRQTTSEVIREMIRHYIRISEEHDAKKNAKPQNLRDPNTIDWVDNCIESGELLSAAKTGAKWMRWWLEQDECECEYDHTCGKPERTRELEQMEAAIAKAEGR